jgi:hypothetical protein
MTPTPPRKTPSLRRFVGYFVLPSGSSAYRCEHGAIHCTCASEPLSLLSSIPTLFSPLTRGQVILEDLQLLGIKFDQFTHTSDYFDLMVGCLHVCVLVCLCLILFSALQQFDL